MILLSCPANWWWERSPYGSGSNSFCSVGSSGSAGNGSAYGTGGVCFGFHKESGPT